MMFQALQQTALSKLKASQTHQNRGNLGCCKHVQHSLTILWWNLERSLTLEHGNSLITEEKHFQ